MRKRNGQNELNARLAVLAETRSLSDIARRTGTSVANVSRYLSGTRIPGEFCTALVRGLGVNPSWLLTGEGSPSLSDVTDGTASMAGDVLELVEAMAAVTRMRLGALTGKHHLRVLRELNDALQRHEDLRERLNRHSAPIFRRLIDELGKALGKLDVDRAHELRKAAAQVERLCDEPELSRRFTAQQAHCEVLDMNNGAALQYQRRLVRDAVGEGHLVDEAICEQVLRLALITRDAGEPVKAVRICNAAIALLDDESKQWLSAHALRFLRGNILADTGRLFEGLREMQVHAPHVTGRRGMVGRMMLMRAMLLAGLMEFDEAFHYAADAEPKGLHLLEYATLTEQRDKVERALGFFRTKISVLPGFLDWPSYAEHFIRAFDGERKAAADYERIARQNLRYAEPPSQIIVNQATLHRLARAKAQARKLTDQADERIAGRMLGVSLLTRHYRNVLHLGTTGKAEARANDFFAEMRRAGYVTLTAA